MSETTEVHDITTLPKKSIFTMRNAAIAAVAVGVGLIVIMKIATKEDADAVVTEAVNA